MLIIFGTVVSIIALKYHKRLGLAHLQFGVIRRKMTETIDQIGRQVCMQITHV